LRPSIDGLNRNYVKISKVKLFEFEGRNLFQKEGIVIPAGVVISYTSDLEQALKRISFPAVAKVQTLSGKRRKRGGVSAIQSEKEARDFVDQFLGKDFEGEQISHILLVQKIDIDYEYFLSITYSTVEKKPILLFSASGGVEVEDAPDMQKIIINPENGINADDLASQLKVSSPKKIADVAVRLWDVFVHADARLAEINPLAVDKNGEIWALDSKIILDDSGLVRHKDLNILDKGSLSSIPTDREKRAKQIDKDDYRGSAGSVYFDLDGDIAVLASGGGASLVVLDSLFNAGGKPANYTEYSGDPPAEKVAKLTEVVLSKPGLKGCLVAGALANFTDIYETLKGFCEGVASLKNKPNYPIVIRRAGVNDQKAKDFVKEFSKKEEINIEFYTEGTPIGKAAERIVELAYK